MSTDEPLLVLARTPPPAFLFPDQRFQRPGPEGPPDCLAPVRGGGGYLNRFVFRVKHFFLKKFSTSPKRPGPLRAEAGIYRSTVSVSTNLPIFFQNRSEDHIPKNPEPNHALESRDPTPKAATPAPLQPVRAGPSPSERPIYAPPLESTSPKSSHRQVFDQTPVLAKLGQGFQPATAVKAPLRKPGLR